MSLQQQNHTEII